MVIPVTFQFKGLSTLNPRKFPCYGYCRPSSVWRQFTNTKMIILIVVKDPLQDSREHFDCLRHNLQAKPQKEIKNKAS